MYRLAPVLALFVAMILFSACDSTVTSVTNGNDFTPVDGDDDDATDGDTSGDIDGDDDRGSLPDLDGDATDGDSSTTDGDSVVADGDATDGDTTDGDTTDGDTTDGDVADGDLDIPDADTELPELEPEQVTDCEAMGGLCSNNGQCAGDTEAAAFSLGCPSVCCLIEDQLPCVQNGGFCLTTDWETHLAYQCGPDYRPADGGMGCDQLWTWCCIPSAASCVGDGEMGNRADDSTANDACCDGLTEIRNRYPGLQGGCENGDEETFLCTACGNGTCDLFENRCNCNEDCAMAGECHVSPGTDCPATTCWNRNSIWPNVKTECVEFNYDCNPQTYYCMQNQNTFFDHICNLQTGRCEQP